MCTVHYYNSMLSLKVHSFICDLPFISRNKNNKIRRNDACKIIEYLH